MSEVQIDPALQLAVPPDVKLDSPERIVPGLEDASHLWKMLESIIEVLKNSPDHDLRLATNIISFEIQMNGLPRLMRLLELAALHAHSAAKQAPN